MDLLRELLESANDVILDNGFVEIERRLGEMRLLVKQLPLTEGFTDNHRGDLDRKFDDIEHKLLAARNMLSKINGANQLSPEEKNEEKSKIMRYINVFRKQLYDVMISLGMSQKEMAFHLNRIDLDREHGKPADVFNRPPQSAEKRRFSDDVNYGRNLANPRENIRGMPGQMSSPEKKVKWYQKMFGR